MFLNLPVVYHGEFYNQKTREWTTHNFVRLNETFEIGHMDDSCQLAATNLNVPGLPTDLDVFWHDDACWIRDTDMRPLHWPRSAEQPSRFDPLDRKCLVKLARDAAVDEHCAGYAGIWGPTARDHWERWADGTSRSPNPRTYSASREVTLDVERERMHEFVAGLRLNDGVLYRRVEVPSFSVDAQGGVTVVFGNKIGEFGSFNLGRSDDLRAYLTETFGPEAASCDLPDAVLPQVFEWDDEKDSFENAVAFAMKAARKYGSSVGDRGQARKRLEAAWHHCFPHDSIEGLRGFCLHFDDSQDADLKSESSARKDAFAREMAIFAETLHAARRVPPRRFGSRITEGDSRAEMQLAAKRIATAAARWQIRPISMRVEPSPMLGM